MMIHAINSYNNIFILGQAPSIKINYVIKRTMLRGVCIYASKAVLYGLQALTNNSVVDNITHDNHAPLARSLVHYSMNNNHGIPQHKETIMTHMITQSFGVDDVYNEFADHYFFNIKWVSTRPTAHQLSPRSAIIVDSRVIKELPVIALYNTKFHHDIDWIIANNDVYAASFPHQKQHHQDFWV